MGDLLKMTFCIELANQRIQVQSIYEKVYDWCKDYLVSSREDAGDPEDGIQIRITPEDKEAMHQTVCLLQSFVQRVDLYRLRCAPTAEAVRLAYETAGPDFLCLR